MKDEQLLELFAREVHEHDGTPLTDNEWEQILAWYKECVKAEAPHYLESAFDVARKILQIVQLSRGEPDYCCDVDNWDTTYAWRDRDDLTADLEAGEIMEIRCMQTVANKWAICITDEEGDETVGWYDNEVEANRVLERWKSSVEGR